jgi:hypothetical protein
VLARWKDCRSLLKPSHNSANTRTDQTESTPILWNPFRVSFGDYIFQGWWQQTGALLHTMVAAPACDQPVLLKISGKPQ